MAVHRQPHATTHADAVHERDVGLRVPLDLRVQQILFAPEIHRSVIATALEQLDERADVAARRECLPAGRLNHNARDTPITGPCGELRPDRADCRDRKCIQGLRPVQRDDAGGPASLEQNFGFGIHLWRRQETRRFFPSPRLRGEGARAQRGRVRGSPARQIRLRRATHSPLTRLASRFATLCSMLATLSPLAGRGFERDTHLFGITLNFPGCRG